MQLLRAPTEFKRGYDLNLTIKSILAEPLSRRPELLRRDAHPGAGPAHSRADQQVPPAGADVQGVRRAAGDEDDPHAARAAGAGRQVVEVPLRDMVDRISAK